MEDKSLHLYTEHQKYANDKQWFKDFMDYIDRQSNLTSSQFIFSNGENDEYKKMQIYYDLFNDKLHKEEVTKYCKEYGYDTELDEEFKNYDIISERVNVLIGLELSRPFYFKPIAVNPEATTRKEQKKFEMIKQFVIQTIMNEIKAMVTQKEMEQQQGKKLSPEEAQRIQQNINQQVEAMTPEEVKEYMERQYQDPAEILASQLLEYMMKELNIKYKFNKGWKHALISGREIYYVYIEDGEPNVDVVNPLHFDYDRNTKTGFIEDGEWAVATYNFSLIELSKRFPELSKKKLKEISQEIPDTLSYSFTETPTDSKITAKHYVWKSLREIGFLTYMDPATGEIRERIVSADYEMRPHYGDIELRKGRMVELYEGWKIGTDTYIRMRKIPFIRDIDKINDVKLPYIGITYDSDNSTPISIVGRLEGYQYLYDIAMMTLRRLMSSDKGKLLLMNAGIIPRSMNINLEKWLYYASKLNIGFFNPHEEGNKILDINAAAKVVDLSLTSDIQKYIQLIEYIERKAGESIGVTQQVIGRIGVNEAVTNAKQSIIQSSYILEPLFNAHNLVKRNVLEYLLDTARLAYSTGKKQKLSYALDDLSNAVLTIDKDMLTFNTFGIFISDTTKPEELKQELIQLAHAALQNQRAEFSDVMKIIKTENIEEAIDMLRVAEKRAIQQQQQMLQQQQMGEANMKKEERDFEMQKMYTEYMHQLQLKKVEIEGQIEIAKIKADNSEKLELEKMKAEIDQKIKEAELQLKKREIELENDYNKEKLKIEAKKAINKPNKTK